MAKPRWLRPRGSAALPLRPRGERGPAKCAGGFATASFVYFVYFVVDKESDGGATIGNRPRLRTEPLNPLNLLPIKHSNNQTNLCFSATLLLCVKNSHPAPTLSVLF